MDRTNEKHESKVTASAPERTSAEMKKNLLIRPGTWYAEFDGNGVCTTVYYADSFRRLLGYEPGEFPDDSATWMDSIHPEDKARAIRELNGCVSEMSDQADYDIEYRMMTKRGDYHWFHDYAHCVRREDGTGTRCDGIVFDIEENVRQQRSMTDHRLLLDYFVDQYWSACFIDLANDTLEIIRANNANTKAYIMDGTHEDMERFIRSHFHPDDIALMLQITDKDFVRKELRDKSSISYTARELINGEEKTMRILIVRGADEDHVAVGFMDITEEVLEQQKRLLGAIPLSNDVLAKSNIGLWSFELDEGQPPRMYADETMLRLLGLDRQIPPEEVYHAWYDHIDQGSYSLVTDAVAKMSSGEHAEVQYPWHHPDGETWIVRCGGVRNYEYTKGIRIEGTHRNVTEVLHFDEEKQKQREKQIIEPFIAQYGIVCKVNLNDASFEALKYDDGGAGYRTDFRDFNAVTDFFAENAVYRSDRAVLRRETDVERMRARLKQEPSYSVEYRVVIGGVAIWHEMVVSTLSENEVVIGFRMNDVEILNRHISKVLMDNYDAIYIANLDTDQMKVLKASGHMINKPAIVPYSKTIREFAMGLEDEAKAYFLKVSDIAYEKEVLKKDGRAEYAYRSPYYGTEPVWVKNGIHVLTWANGEPETAVIGISRVDSLQREKIELNGRLKEALAFTTFFLDTYISAYYVNLDDRSYQVYKRTDELAEKYPLIDDYLESLNGYIERDVHPEDREALKALVRPETMRAMLAQRPEYTHAFRDISGDTEKTYRMQVIRGADEHFAAFGFLDITEEINEQRARRKETEEAAKLIESIASAYRFAFTVDMADGEFKIIRMEPDIKTRLVMEEPRNYQDAISPLFRLLHPADRERMAHELEFGTIAQRLENTVSYNMEYRVIMNGATNWHEMKITHISAEQIAIGFGENDLEITKRHLEDNRFSEYFALYEVDLDTEMAKIVIDSPYYKLGEAGTSLKYETVMNAFADSLAGEAREFFRRLADISFVRQELATEGRHTYSYRSNNLENNRWVDCTSYVTMRYENGAPAMFSLGFSFIDSYGAARQELQNKIRENLEIIEALAADYSSVYYIDADTEKVTPYSMNEETQLKMTAIFRSSDMYPEAFRAYADQFVYEPDKAMVLREGRRENVLKKLADSDSFAITFRGLNDGKVTFCEMKFVVAHRENGKIKSVGLGFTYKDREIMAQYINEKLASEYISAFMVDLDNDKYRIYRNPDTTAVMDRPDRTWSLAMADFARECDPEYFELVKNIGSPAFLRQELADTDRREYLYRFPSATKPWRRAVIMALDRTNGVPGNIVATFMGIDDYQAKINEQKKLLEEQQKQLQEALVEAQAASRAKTEFLFNMSHDVRTPMNAILGFTGMAEKHINDKEKVLDCLEKTKQSGNLLLSLINGVLDMSRIEHGSAEKEEKAGDVYLSFFSIEATLQEEAAKKNIALSFGFGEVKDRYVYADFTRCLRIFTNLITNAIKYTQAGGYVKVFCEQASPAKNGYASYRYTVEDNGIGMSQEFQKRMYESFTREHSTTTSGIQGTGLGLSVCKAFVEYLGGTLECESELGKGTRFTVVLPFRLQEENHYTDPLTGELVTAFSAPPENYEQFDFSGRRVLLVEDNELNREIAVDILEEKGLEVEMAQDGSVAVELLREKGPAHYDFILMDIQMPVMNGYEATNAIRAMYPGKHIPIIALSANAFAEDKAASLAAGMDDHVAKPIDIRELFKVLARYL